MAVLRAAPSPFLADRDVQREPKARASLQSTSIYGTYGLKKRSKMPRRSSGIGQRRRDEDAPSALIRVAGGAPRRLPPPPPSPCVAAFNEVFPRGPRRISRQNANFWHMGTRRKSPKNASEIGEILTESTTHPKQDPRAALCIIPSAHQNDKPVVGRGVECDSGRV